VRDSILFIEYQLTHQDFHRTITGLKENYDESYKTIDHPTLFHELLYSDLSEDEKSVKRMVQEAQVIVSAAILTSSWAAAVASFHIINTPDILRKLRAELVEAIPDPLTLLDWQNLEHLPYLTGCIKEGIRLSYGISSRMPRMARQDLKYKDWVIPAGTPISMTIVNMNHDEEIFPHSHKFIPERWVNNPTTKDGQPLDRYFVGFGKGARQCIGLKYVLFGPYDSCKPGTNHSQSRPGRSLHGPRGNLQAVHFRTI